MVGQQSNARGAYQELTVLKVGFYCFLCNNSFDTVLLYNISNALYYTNISLYNYATTSVNGAKLDFIAKAASYNRWLIHYFLGSIGAILCNHRGFYGLYMMLT